MTMCLTYSKCNGSFSYCNVMIAMVMRMLLLAMTLGVLQRKEVKRKASLTSGRRRKEMGERQIKYLFIFQTQNKIEYCSRYVSRVTIYHSSVPGCLCCGIIINFIPLHLQN